MNKFKISTGLRDRNNLNMWQIVHGFDVQLVGAKDIHILDQTGAVVGIVHYAHGVVSVMKMANDEI
jgi:hypothetical protein